MSITNLRYTVLAAALSIMVFGSSKLGWGLGFLSIAVPVAWLWYFSLRFSGFSSAEDGASEPLPALYWTVTLCFAAAVLIAPAFVFTAELLNNGFAAAAAGNQLLYFVLRAGLVEELLKLTAVLIVLKYLAAGTVRHPKDGIVLACAAGLGFSAYENLYHNLYLVQLESGAAQAFFLGALVRVPLHALYASIWGAALGVSRFMSASARYLVLTLGLVPAAFLHGLWDTLAQSQGTATGVMLTLLYGAFWVSYWRTWRRCQAIELVNKSASSNQV